MAGTYFQNLLNQDRSNFNNFFGALGGTVGDVSSRMPEFTQRFDNPTEFARAVARYMLGQAGSERYLTPGYREFLISTAPQAYALQQMMAPAYYGQVAGQDFGQFYQNWLAPRFNGQYGFGGLTSPEMRNLWGAFTNRAREAQGGGGSPEMQAFFSSLSPSDFQAFHELALRSTMSPFALSVMGRYLDRAYSDWADFTKAVPWINFLQTIAPGNSLFG